VAAILQASQPLTTPFSLFHFFIFSLFTAVLARRRGNRAGDSGAGLSASRAEAEA
jgi:hypothetical protein